ncbi:EDR1-related protein [uncultured Gimesia sp.]|uniref:EDR1-related protein n=1 Tax=uncultured Gimesia sp. TaxID=1678688 RepID=UPI0030D825B8
MRRIQFIGLLLLIGFFQPISQAVAETTLINFGKQSEWKYQDNGKALPLDWVQPTFEDAKWPTGPAPLGYGDTGLNTTVRFGDDSQKKQITTYFRRAFQIEDATKLKKLVLLIRSDDGIVVYLNGKEIIRNNLPAGQVTAETTAIEALGRVVERIYQRFTVSADNLVSGTNVIAVEVHQANPRSTDLFLDLVLRSYQDEIELRPTLTPKAKPATVAYYSQHYVAPKLKIVDGYFDGGRGMQFDAEGHARSRRELLIVDRSRDETLRKYLEFAGSDEIKELEPSKRASRLAKYIDQNMTLEKNDFFTQKAVFLMTREYGNEGVLIGDVSRICGAGVCRHRALLFKILADEAGLDVALVRGDYGDAQRREGHAWNELHLKDGRRILIDVMQRRFELLTPEGSEVSRRYLTVDNKPWYGKQEPSDQKP